MKSIVCFGNGAYTSLKRTRHEVKFFDDGQITIS
jgi:hypothetical protein